MKSGSTNIVSLFFGSGGIIDESKGFGVDDDIESSIQKSATDILWIDFTEVSLPWAQFCLGSALEHRVSNSIFGNPFSAVIA